MTAHWGIADPAAVVGTEDQKRHAFFNAFRELSQRIRIFTSLPIRSWTRSSCQERLNSIGKTTSTDEVAELSLDRKLLAEALGAFLLAAAVIGSGITGERLAGGSAAIAPGQHRRDGSCVGDVDRDARSG